MKFANVDTIAVALKTTTIPKYQVEIISSLLEDVDNVDASFSQHLDTSRSVEIALNFLDEQTEQSQRVAILLFGLATRLPQTTNDLQISIVNILTEFLSSCKAANLEIVREGALVIVQAMKRLEESALLFDNIVLSHLQDNNQHIYRIFAGGILVTHLFCLGAPHQTDDSMKEKYLEQLHDVLLLTCSESYPNISADFVSILSHLLACKGGVLDFNALQQRAITPFQKLSLAHAILTFTVESQKKRAPHKHTRSLHLEPHVKEFMFATLSNGWEEKILCEGVQDHWQLQFNFATLLLQAYPREDKSVISQIVHHCSLVHKYKDGRITAVAVKTLNTVISVCGKRTKDLFKLYHTLDVDGILSWTFSSLQGSLDDEEEHALLLCTYFELINTIFTTWPHRNAIQHLQNQWSPRVCREVFRNCPITPSLFSTLQLFTPQSRQNISHLILTIINTSCFKCLSILKKSSSPMKQYKFGVSGSSSNTPITDAMAFLRKLSVIWNLFNCCPGSNIHRFIKHHFYSGDNNIRLNAYVTCTFLSKLDVNGRCLCSERMDGIVAMIENLAFEQLSTVRFVLRRVFSSDHMETPEVGEGLAQLYKTASMEMRHMLRKRFSGSKILGPYLTRALTIEDISTLYKTKLSPDRSQWSDTYASIHEQLLALDMHAPSSSIVEALTNLYNLCCRKHYVTRPYIDYVHLREKLIDFMRHKDTHVRTCTQRLLGSFGAIFPFRQEQLLLDRKENFTPIDADFRHSPISHKEMQDLAKQAYIFQKSEDNEDPPKNGKFDYIRINTLVCLVKTGEHVSQRHWYVRIAEAITTLAFASDLTCRVYALQSLTLMARNCKKSQLSALLMHANTLVECLQSDTRAEPTDLFYAVVRFWLDGSSPTDLAIHKATICLLKTILSSNSREIKEMITFIFGHIHTKLAATAKTNDTVIMDNCFEAIGLLCCVDLGFPDVVYHILQPYISLSSDKLSEGCSPLWRVSKVALQTLGNFIKTGLCRDLSALMFHDLTSLAMEMLSTNNELVTLTLDRLYDVLMLCPNDDHVTLMHELICKMFEGDMDEKAFSRFRLKNIVAARKVWVPSNRQTLVRHCHDSCSVAIPPITYPTKDPERAFRNVLMGFARVPTMNEHVGADDAWSKWLRPLATALMECSKANVFYECLQLASENAFFAKEIFPLAFSFLWLDHSNKQELGRITLQKARENLLLRRLFLKFMETVALHRTLFQLNERNRDDGVHWNLNMEDLPLTLFEAGQFALSAHMLSLAQFFFDSSVKNSYHRWFRQPDMFIPKTEELNKALLLLSSVAYRLSEPFSAKGYEAEWRVVMADPDLAKSSDTPPTSASESSSMAIASSDFSTMHFFSDFAEESVSLDEYLFAQRLTLWEGGHVLPNPPISKSDTDELLWLDRSLRDHIPNEDIVAQVSTKLNSPQLALSARTRIKFATTAFDAVLEDGHLNRHLSDTRRAHITQLCQVLQQDHTAQSYFLRAVGHAIKDEFDEADKLIEVCRSITQNDLKDSLLDDASNYEAYLQVMMLCELEEAIRLKQQHTSSGFSRFKSDIVECWRHRVGSLEYSINVWRRVFNLRRIAISCAEEPISATKFGTLCRRSVAHGVCSGQEAIHIAQPVTEELERAGDSQTVKYNLLKHRRFIEIVNDEKPYVAHKLDNLIANADKTVTAVELSKMYRKKGEWILQQGHHFWSRAVEPLKLSIQIAMTERPLREYLTLVYALAMRTISQGGAFSSSSSSSSPYRGNTHSTPPHKGVQDQSQAQFGKLNRSFGGTGYANKSINMSRVSVHDELARDGAGNNLHSSMLGSASLNTSNVSFTSTYGHNQSFESDIVEDELIAGYVGSYAHAIAKACSSVAPTHADMARLIRLTILASDPSVDATPFSAALERIPARFFLPVQSIVLSMLVWHNEFSKGKALISLLLNMLRHHPHQIVTGLIVAEGAVKDQNRCDNGCEKGRHLLLDVLRRLSPTITQHIEMYKLFCDEIGRSCSSITKLIMGIVEQVRGKQTTSDLCEPSLFHLSLLVSRINDLLERKQHKSHTILPDTHADDYAMLQTKVMVNGLQNALRIAKEMIGAILDFRKDFLVPKHNVEMAQVESAKKQAAISAAKKKRFSSFRERKYSEFAQSDWYQQLVREGTASIPTTPMRRRSDTSSLFTPSASTSVSKHSPPYGTIQTPSKKRLASIYLQTQREMEESVFLQPVPKGRLQRNVRDSRSQLLPKDEEKDDATAGTNAIASLRTLLSESSDKIIPKNILEQQQKQKQEQEQEQEKEQEQMQKPFNRRHQDEDGFIDRTKEEITAKALRADVAKVLSSANAGTTTKRTKRRNNVSRRHSMTNVSPSSSSVKDGHRVMVDVESEISEEVETSAEASVFNSPGGGMSDSENDMASVERRERLLAIRIKHNLGRRLKDNHVHHKKNTPTATGNRSVSSVTGSSPLPATNATTTGTENTSDSSSQGVGSHHRTSKGRLSSLSESDISPSPSSPRRSFDNTSSDGGIEITIHKESVSSDATNITIVQQKQKQQLTFVQASQSGQEPRSPTDLKKKKKGNKKDMNGIDDGAVLVKDAVHTHAGEKAELSTPVMKSTPKKKILTSPPNMQTHRSSSGDKRKRQNNPFLHQPSSVEWSLETSSVLSESGGSDFDREVEDTVLMKMVDANFEFGEYLGMRWVQLERYLLRNNGRSRHTADNERSSQQLISLVQHGDFIMPRNTEEEVFIHGVQVYVKKLGSKQQPRVFQFVGTDGKIYKFLGKAHEDLRQDERVMEIARELDTALKTKVFANHERLAIETYDVTPMSTNHGLVEWREDYTDYESVIMNYNRRSGLMPSRGLPDYYNFIPQSLKHKTFREHMQKARVEDFRDALMFMSSDAGEFLQRQKNFSQSTAVMSYFGYVLGLGDRHPKNILLHQRTSGVLHVDYGDLFETAQRRLHYPERVFFRMTPSMRMVLDIGAEHGLFQRVGSLILSTLQSNFALVFESLACFKHAPTSQMALSSEEQSSEIPIELFAEFAQIKSWNDVHDFTEHHDLGLSDESIAVLEEFERTAIDPPSQAIVGVINRTFGRTRYMLRELKSIRMQKGNIPLTDAMADIVFEQATDFASLVPSFTGYAALL